MGTAVPPITFGPNGFVAPTGPEVLAGVQADINAAFGATLNFDLRTPQGQLASTLAALIVNANSIFVYYANQVDPAFSSGRFQDAIGRIYDLSRDPAEPTTLEIACGGATGVPIPVGAIIRDASQNLYTCTGSGVIPSSGTITLTFACTVPGPIAVPPTKGVFIYQSIPGWDTVSVVSGAIGSAVENRAQFEARRQESLAVNSNGSLPAVQGAVLSVSGVLDAYVTENDTDGTLTIGGFTLAPKSIYVAAVGGSDLDVATAIWKHKAPGCGYNGNTTVTVEDTSVGYSPPLPSYEVQFERPANLEILFAIQMANGAGVPADATTQIQNAIIGAFAGADGGPRVRIGSTISALRFVAPIQALGLWAQVTTIKIGSNNTPSAVGTASIAGTILTVSALASGAFAVGQTVGDATGAITAGTIIQSQLSGTPGGIGTYALSGSPQTVSSEQVFGSVANLDTVTANIDQEPTTQAGDIQVVFV